MTGSGVRRLTIVGTGLLGASVGLAAKRAGVERVVGYDLDHGALQGASERGAIDGIGASFADAVVDVDLVVIATPVSTIVELAVAALDATNSAATVTDVGSTKGGGSARSSRAGIASSEVTRSVAPRRAALRRRAPTCSTARPGSSHRPRPMQIASKSWRSSSPRSARRP